MDGKYLIKATYDHRTINNACDRSLHYELISPLTSCQIFWSGNHFMIENCTLPSGYSTYLMYLTYEIKK